MSKFQAHKDAPDEVWLQIGYGDEGTHTWASHQVAEDDIEQAGPYVRADRLSGRVRVKPLEWEFTGIDRTQENATTDLAHYAVWEIGGRGYLQTQPFRAGQACDGDIKAAKAAAQADYEARILAALEPAPTPDAGQGGKQSITPMETLAYLARLDGPVADEHADNFDALCAQGLVRADVKIDDTVGSIFEITEAGRSALSSIPTPDAREKVKTVRSPRAVRRKALLEAAAVAAGYSDQAQAAILDLIDAGGGDD